MPVGWVKPPAQGSSVHPAAGVPASVDRGPAPSKTATTSANAVRKRGPPARTYPGVPRASTEFSPRGRSGAEEALLVALGAGEGVLLERRRRQVRAIELAAELPRR